MSHLIDDASPRQRLADVKAQVEVAAVQAKDLLVPLAETAVQKARPVVDDAWAKVADVVDHDILPRLAEWRDQAAPMLDEATQRGRLAVAAIKGDAQEPEPAQKRRGHPVLKTIGIAAIVGALLLLVRALLDARDDGWELQDAVFDDDVDEQPAQNDETPTPEEPAADDPHRYGDGSYIGQEPPEGYVIKANERSMKFHMPRAIGYERCVTDIWFNSPEAAERAGFTRSLR